METPTRPTTHVLKPHHVGLLMLFTVVFKDHEMRYPAPFALHIYRVLLNEVAEIAEPKSLLELEKDFRAGPKATHQDSLRLFGAVHVMRNSFRNTDQMDHLFRGASTLFVEKGDDDDTTEPPPFAPRSIFGFFCRRCYVTYTKLSLSGVRKLQRDFLAWSSTDTIATYKAAQKHASPAGDHLWLFKTSADRKTWAQTDAYSAWEKGQVTGDENIAAENLRRFFEQRFHDHNDSGFRQHAMLNLVRMHYARNEYTAARKLLSEAIAVSRTSGDKVTLQHCISLLHRIPPTEPGKRPTLNEIQPELHPLEILFDVQKLMHIEHQQPLSASFDRMVQAMGVFDHWAETQRARGKSPSTDADHWGFNAVESIVWDAVGCDELAAVEEDIVTAFTDVCSDDNNRITVTLNRAYKQARHGSYSQALVMLLDPDVWRGLTLNDYLLWANQVWHILVLRASRRGQARLMREFLEPHRPPGHYNPREYWFGCKGGQAPLIGDPLYEVMELSQCDQAAVGVDHLLKALWHSEFLGRFRAYRTGIILLADVGLEFGMTKRSRRILEENMPQIINGYDLEQRALACFTLARCIIAIAEPDLATSLQEALPLLHISATDYDKLELLRPLMDVQYLMSVVYHNLGMESQREEAATNHFQTEEKMKRLGAVVVDEEVQEVWKLVVDVGAALSAR